MKKSLAELEVNRMKKTSPLEAAFLRVKSMGWLINKNSNYLLPPFVFHQFKKDITDRENAALLYGHKTPHWVPSYWGDFNVRNVMFFDSERPQSPNGAGGPGIDWFGVEWVDTGAFSAPMVKPGQVLLTDITKWREQVKFPDLDALDWQRERKYYTKKDKPDRMNLHISCEGPFERLHDLMGFEEALVAMIEEPEACAEFISAVADHKIKLFTKLRQYLDIDVVVAQDDLGSQTNGFFSLDTFREVLLPSYKRMVDAVHELGMIYQFHSCGKVDMYIPDLVEIGIDAWDSAQTCNDLAGIKAKYGDRLVIAGGLDSTTTLGRADVPKKVQEQHVRDQIDKLAVGGGYMPVAYTPEMSAYVVVGSVTAQYGSTFYLDPKNR